MSKPKIKLAGHWTARQVSPLIQVMVPEEEAGKIDELVKNLKTILQEMQNEYGLEKGEDVLLGLIEKGVRDIVDKGLIEEAGSVEPGPNFNLDQ